MAAARPGVLLAVDGYRYGAQGHRRAPTDRRDRRRGRRRSATWCRSRTSPTAVVGRHPVGRTARRPGAGPLTFESVPFDHPLYVLFSSGTTGLPKAIVHSHGGMVVEHLKALRLHHDMTPDDVFLWFTTTGWMMWNYLVSGLLTGADDRVVRRRSGLPRPRTPCGRSPPTSGSPCSASAHRSCMGCREAGIEPARDFASAVRQVGSTGSPLPADGFRWVRDHVGSRVQLCSISGGTDVCTAFLGAAPAVPGARGRDQHAGLLGCDVEGVRRVRRRVPTRRDR